ncbi:ABC transporter permease subunit [Phytoactinopolyspora limicola]|uniref:ABC transporter permease subunit n=1 Tax=Phytoactinopolyspora limicola TaxID=2715536 RepID=UPI00140922E8|nr:ABC transporter permease subunit [Phytoactinopolyspora limicola]
MIGGKEVVVHAHRRLRRGALIWAGVLLALIFSVMAAWPGFRDSETGVLTDDLPTAVTRAFGLSDLGDPAGFLDSNLFSLVLPLLLICVAVAWANGLTAGDEDAGRLEVELSLPVTRAGLMVRRFIVAAGWLVGLGVVVVLGLLVAMPALDLDASLARTMGATAAVVLLAILHGAVYYCAAGLGAPRNQALGIAGGVAGAGYVLRSLLPLSEPLEPVEVVSPWYWLLGDGPVQHGVPIGGAVLALVMVGVLLMVGNWGLTRRDIRPA